MRLRAIALALSLMPLGAPHAAFGEAAAVGGCPTTPARPARPVTPTLPAETKITSKQSVFEIDVGSDGRVRGLQMDRSSGDGAVDLSIRQTLEAATYDPPQAGCVAHSGGFLLTFELPVDLNATATPAAGPNTNCTPYIVAFLIPGPRDRKRTGNAVVAVELDAAATPTAAPVLKKSTGSAVLDAEALRIAKTGQYRFLDGSSCAPAPFTYNLELTFQ